VLLPSATIHSWSRRKTGRFLASRGFRELSWEPHEAKTNVSNLAADWLNWKATTVLIVAILAALVATG